MHHHVSGIESLKAALSVIAILGALNLLAMKMKDKSSFWASWANLFGLD